VSLVRRAAGAATSVRARVVAGACLWATACGDDRAPGTGGGGGGAAPSTVGSTTTASVSAASGVGEGGTASGGGGRGGGSDGGSGGTGGGGVAGGDATGGGLPAGWSCDELWYEDGVACDCGCGATDPDCLDGSALVYGCGPPHLPAEGVTCDDAGRCVVPSGWRCDADRFADGDVCDCECGEVDVDCVPGGLPVEGCRDPDDACSDARCVAPPESDACDPRHFGVGDGCDCGCPGYDVDCDDPEAAVHGCGPAHPAGDGVSCEPDGGCPAPETWSCNVEAFCGGDDPDCDIDLGLPVQGCVGDQRCLLDVCREVPAGDRCETAIDLVEGEISGEWTVARHDYQMGDGLPPSCVLYGTPGRDIVYRVTLLAGQTLTVDAASDAPVDLSIYVVTSCDDLPSSCLAGADDLYTGLPEHLELTSTDGGEVFLIVDQYRGPTPGTFTLDVDISP
jgi:hypothetical protein